MTIVGSSGGGSNLVANPPRLPYPLFFGQISWSSSADQAPTVSIEYKGLPYEQVGDLYGAWDIPLGADVTNSYVFINNAYLRVTSISYSRQRLVYRGDRSFYIYSVSIELGNAHVDQNKEAEYDDVIDNAERVGFVDWTPRSGPRLIRMGEGGSWSFPNEQVLQDGTNSKSMDLLAFNRTELILNYPPFGKDGSLYLKEPVITETESGDPDPEIPPPDTYLFRDLSNVFDQGGDRKDWRKTKRIDNQVYEEEIRSYGFVYYGEDGHNSLTLKSFVINNPQDYWRQVGYRKIQSLFQEIESLSLEVEIVLPGNLEKIGFLVDPDYEQFAQKNGNILRVKTRARYLMIQEETGWELNRFVKEEQPGMGARMESKSTIIGDDEKGVDENGVPLSYYPYLKFQRVPIRSRTIYSLEPTRKYYVREDGEDIVNQPFSIEYTPYVDLPLYLKEKLGNAEQLEEEGLLTPDLKVPIVKPDPNYVEPLFIAKEERRENSFRFERDWIAELNQGPDAVTGDPAIFLTMGYSLIRTVTRKPVLGNRVEIGGTVQFNTASGDGLFEYGYTEHTSEVRAEGPKFREARQKLSFAEQNSLPPEAQYLLTQWVDKKQDPQYFQKQSEKLRWYLTTDNSELSKPGGTLNLEARSIEEARQLIEMRLRRDAAGKIQSQKTVAWWIPGIKPGDTVSTDDLHGDRWSVFGVSWTIEYKGKNNATGRVFATCGGTQLTLGQDVDRSYSLKSRSGGYTSSIDPQVKVKLASDVIPTGDPLPIEPSRRNFG